eukprot:6176645-Pleurochrysis_carterae.AAC.1
MTELVTSGHKCVVLKFWPKCAAILARPPLATNRHVEIHATRTRPLLQMSASKRPAYTHFAVQASAPALRALPITPARSQGPLHVYERRMISGSAAALIVLGDGPPSNLAVS